MAMTVHCDLVSAEEPIFSGLVEMVVAPGTEGDLGIIAGHAPLLTRLKPGPIRVILQGGAESCFFVSGGFLEVQPDRISVLCDTVLRESDLDIERARAAQEEARQALHASDDTMDLDEAMVELERALGQLRTLERLKRK
jgi:F-type H+-transporting ATPase subunit epsilon